MVSSRKQFTAGSYDILTVSALPLAYEPLWFRNRPTCIKSDIRLCLKYDLYVRSDCIKKSSIHIQLWRKNWVWETFHAIACSELFSDVQSTCTLLVQVIALNTKGFTAHKVELGRYHYEWLVTFCVDTTACPHGKVLTLSTLGGFREDECCVQYVVVPFSPHLRMAAISVKRNLKILLPEFKPCMVWPRSKNKE